jgi:hypothetical protein
MDLRGDHPAAGQGGRLHNPVLAGEYTDARLNASLGLVERCRQVSRTLRRVVKLVALELLTAAPKPAQDQLVQFVIAHKAAKPSLPCPLRLIMG